MSGMQSVGRMVMADAVQRGRRRWRPEGVARCQVQTARHLNVQRRSLMLELWRRVAQLEKVAQLENREGALMRRLGLL